MNAKEYIETNGGVVRVHCEPNHAYILREDVYRLMEEYATHNKNLLSHTISSESEVNSVCDTRKHNWDYIKGKIHCDECGHPLHIADKR